MAEITPLSLGSWDAQTGQSSGAAAAGGVSTLANAMIGNPAAAAQARYLGAETGRAQAQTSGLAKTQADQQQITALLTPGPSSAGILDPLNVAHAAAIAAGNPELAAQWPHGLATVMQLAAQRGGAGAPTQAQADTLAAGTGVAAAGNTTTGQGLDLANRVQTANIAAGPGYASAAASRYGADRQYAASTENQASTEAGLDRRTLAQTRDPQGNPVWSTAANAPGQPAYDSPLATTLAGNDQKYVPVQTPTGGTTLATQKNVATQGLTPRASEPAQVLAAVQQDTMQPPAQPAGAAPGVPGAQPAAASLSPAQQQIKDGVMAAAGGRPPPGASSPQDAIAVDKMITDRLKAAMPGRFSSNVPAQGLLDPIRLQAAYLHDHDPSVRGDWNAAVTQAIQNVTGAKGEGVDYDVHTPVVGSAGPSQLVLRPGANIVWPPGMPVPAQYAQPAAPAGPSPLAGAMTGQPAAGASPPTIAQNGGLPQGGPGAPPSLAAAMTGAPQGVMPRPAAAQFREGQTATGPGGQKIVFRNGAWTPL